MSYETEFVLFHQDLNKLLRALEGSIVQTLLEVTQQDTPTMGVKVGSGDALIIGNYHTKYQATNLSIANADVTNPRKDIVCMKSDGTLVSSGVDSSCKGIAGPADPADKTGPRTRTPKPPNIPSGYLLLAEVWVPANATSILNANITDRRVLGSQYFPANLGDTHNQSRVASQGGYMREGYIYSHLRYSERLPLTNPVGGIVSVTSCWDSQLLRGFGTYEWKLRMENWESGKMYCSGFWWHFRCTLQGAYFARKSDGSRVSITGKDAGVETNDVVDWDENVESTMKIEWTPTFVKFYVNGALKTTHSTIVPDEPIHFGSEIDHALKDSNYANDSGIWVKDWKRIA